MIKIIKYELKQIIKFPLVLVLLSLIISIIMFMIILISNEYKTAFNCFKIMHYSSYIIVSILVLYIPAIIAVISYRRKNIFCISDISNLKINASKLFTVFLSVSLFCLILLAENTLIDLLITFRFPYYAAMEYKRDFIFNLSERGILSWFFAFGIGFFSTILFSSLLVIVKVFKRKKNFYIKTVWTVLTSIVIIAVQIGILVCSNYLPFANYNIENSIWNIIPYSSAIFIDLNFITYTTYLFTINIFNIGLVLFELLFILVCILLYEGQAHFNSSIKIKNIFKSSKYILLAVILLFSFVYSTTVYFKKDIGRNDFERIETEKILIFADVGDKTYVCSNNFDYRIKGHKLFYSERKNYWKDSANLDDVFLDSNNNLHVKKSGIYRYDISADVYFNYSVNLVSLLVISLDKVYNDYIEVYSLDDFLYPEGKYILRSDLVIDENSDLPDNMIFKNFNGILVNPYKYKITITETADIECLFYTVGNTAIIDGLIIEGNLVNDSPELSTIACNNSGAIMNCDVKVDIYSSGFTGGLMVNNSGITISNYYQGVISAYHHMGAITAMTGNWMGPFSYSELNFNNSSDVIYISSNERNKDIVYGNIIGYGWQSNITN